MDSHIRSIAKAMTWRTGGTIVTVAVAYAITGAAETAATIGLADTVIKLGAYYVHERLWAKIGFGQKKTPDYQI